MPGWWRSTSPYDLDYVLHPSDIAWTSEGDLQIAHLVTHMALYDAKNLMIGGNDVPADLKLTAKQLEMARTQGVHLHLKASLALTPGTHLRLAVEDLGSQHLGTVEIAGSSVIANAPGIRAN